MYLSGAPLHVITLTLAHEFRQKMGAEFPISFSAGVDRKNFPALVACGFVPITTCTDLLKTGGDGRLPAYLHDLTKEMSRVNAKRVDDYILDHCQHRVAADGNSQVAGLLNTADVVQRTQANPRFHQTMNRSTPRKIDSHLVTFDCITCYKCIPVCPNDANFVYCVSEKNLLYQDIWVDPDGLLTLDGQEKPFVVDRSEQIANFADYCNHCGNCDTFCPEYDGPYLMKPTFFGSREAYESAPAHDGFFLEIGDWTSSSPVQDQSSRKLIGRIHGKEYCLIYLPDGSCHFSTESLMLPLTAEGRPNTNRTSCRPSQRKRIDMGRFHLMATLLEGITNTQRIHTVNTPLTVGSV